MEWWPKGTADVTQLDAGDDGYVWSAMAWRARAGETHTTFPPAPGEDVAVSTVGLDGATSGTRRPAAPAWAEAELS